MVANDLRKTVTGSTWSAGRDPGSHCVLGLLNAPFSQRWPDYRTHPL